MKTDMNLIFAEANRDILDWSGRKALDYRKQSTTISASTYSSKYGENIYCNKIIPLAALSIGYDDTYEQMKRMKRFSTMNGMMKRTKSMRSFVKSPSSINIQALPKRVTYFLPELDHEKRNRTYYHSLLFRKKSTLLTK